MLYPETEDHLERLSQRECEVIRLCAWGATTADIATDLHIAQITVKTHLNNIRGKLHARNSTHAVTLAILYGFISLSDVCQSDRYQPPMERAAARVQFSES